MSARLKSSVLRREERGLGNISMGRLILSGLFGGGVFMLMRVLGLASLMIPSGLITFILSLILTSPRHGIPLYLYGFITMKARLTLSSEGMGQSFAHALGWYAEDLLIEASNEYFSAENTDSGTLDEWEIVPESAQLVGFEVVTDTILLGE